MAGFGQTWPTISGVDVNKLPPEKVAALLHMLREQAAQRAVQTGQPFQDPIAALLGRSPTMQRAKDAISQSPMMQGANKAAGAVGGFLNRSADQMERGWQTLTGEDPAGMTAANPEFWNRRAQGASDVLRGSSPFLLPMAGTAAAEAPVAALLGLGAGIGAGAGTEALGKKAGMPGGIAALTGDVAGLGAGMAVGETAPRNLSELGDTLEAAGRKFDELNAGSDERGSISEKPKKGKLKADDETTARPAVAGGPGGELPAAAQGPAASVVQKRPAGNPDLRRVTNEYNSARGLPAVDHAKYHPVDETFSAKVADAYDALKDDNSADPKVKAAYEALVKETNEQWDHLVQAGYKLEPWTKEGQPYANSHEMVKDLRDNKHLWFFQGGEPHPFMDAIDPATGLSGTDKFRAVHDVYGHAAAGYGFGARGEEGAHDIHSQSFSPLARAAMSTETRGQNSWVNFGKQNYDAEGKPLNIPAAEKPFAKQKVDLLPEELQQRAGERQAAAAQPAKKARDVKKRTIEDLEKRIPPSVRVVSPDPTKTIDGKPFSSLDLDAPGEGWLPLAKHGLERANAMEKQAWEESINESEVEGGTAARDAVTKTGARPPGAQFWDKAFRLPKRTRFWYEVSGESFTGEHFDLPRHMQPRLIDAVAGTSGGVEPGPNARRGIGILAEDLQKQPVMTDLRDPASARKALSPEPLRSLKYRSFSGTMQHVTGLSPEQPLSTNDVQVASTFGIKGTDIGSNPVLYEVLSRFYLKMRDMQNALQEKGAQPWESWQMQASGWVHERALKDPAKASEYDDYSLVLPAIKKELKDAGIPVPNDKITMETLMDPRLPNITSGTREHFQKTPVGTMEVATKLTPEGAAAADLHAQLKQMDPSIPWVRKATKKYEQIQRNMMGAIMKRRGGNKELGIDPEPSLVSQLASIITGQKIDVSRIDRTGYGIFKDDMSPNMRIPMTGRGAKEWIALDSVQREAMLSILGQDAHQEAMASSLFDTTLNRPDMHTFSVFLRRYDGVVDQKAISAFSNELGFPVNVSQVPNGVLIDVNIEKLPSGEFGPRPAAEAVENAARTHFDPDARNEDIIVLGRKYDSNYVHQSQYEEKIDAWRKAPVKGKVAEKSGRAGRAGNTAQRTRDLARVRKKIQSHAKVRDVKFGEWTETTRARLQKHLEAEAK